MKRYLLDPHLFYWWMTGDARLGEATQGLIAESGIVVSTASVWEMVLKSGKGKLPLPPGDITDELEAQGFVLLPILPRHITALRSRHCSHTDPFDRLLIAQANDERLTLLTRDAAILELQLGGVARAWRHLPVRRPLLPGWRLVARSVVGAQSHARKRTPASVDSAPRVAGKLGQRLSVARRAG
jgi:PIN domain nuclease of toxin-antitoxin system